VKHGPWGRHGRCTARRAVRRPAGLRPASPHSHRFHAARRLFIATSRSSVPRGPPRPSVGPPSRRPAPVLQPPGRRADSEGACRLLPVLPYPRNRLQRPPLTFFPPRGTAVPIRRREARRRLTSTIHHQNWQLMDAYQAASGCRRRCRCCCCAAGVSVLPPGSSWAAAAAAGRSSERRSG